MAGGLGRAARGARVLTVIGVDSDPTVGHFVQAAHRSGCALDLLNLRAAVDGEWQIPVGGDAPAVLTFGGRTMRLDPAQPYYCRLIDLGPRARRRGHRQRWASLIAGLAAWLECAPGEVANRPGHHADNGAKPLHEAWLRAQGFAVPPSLTSSSGERLAAFAAAGPTIAKSVAGVRADTRSVAAADFAGFVPERGPVHLQRRIMGRDLRVHVVGDEVHGELIECDAVDYRTASARFSAFAPPPDLAGRLIAATCAAGLLFAGWDFKLDDDGRFWCLEANPMPGYDGYDSRACGAISNSLVARLTSRR